MKSVIFSIVMFPMTLALFAHGKTARHDALSTGGRVWTAVSLQDIRIGGVIGERIALTVTNNLMKLDYDRDFIRQFVTKDGAKSFIGTGNVIESLVALARYTDDPRVMALKRRLVDAIVTSQLPDGYIGCMKEKDRNWVAWDVEDIGFILDGLVLDWRVFKERRSLDAAVRAADRTITTWRNPPEGYDREIYDKELLMGLAHGVWSLYEVTDDTRYADFVTDTMGYGDADLPVILGRDYGLKGQIDGYLDTCLTQIEMYGKTGDSRLLRQFNRFMDHFLNQNGALIHGVEGICECFSGDQDGAGFAGETCMSAYLLCVLDVAIRKGAVDVALAGDVMERTLYNSFFAAQSRDGRRLRYYTPIEGKRPYWPADDFCCPCNYRRVVAHLPEYVFYVSKDEVLINLYAPASGQLSVGGTQVRFVEETDYPTSGGVTIRLDPASESAFAVSLRIPRWCGSATVSVNGERQKVPAVGGLMRIARRWRSGDVIRADFPMDVRLVRGRARQQGRFAVMRGPLVYALNAEGLALERGKWAEGAGNDLTLPEDVMVVYPDTLRVVAGDESARSGGTAIEATVSLVPYQLGKDCGFARPMVVRFTEFANPSNTLTYFRVPDPRTAQAVDDELFRAQ